MGRQDAAPTAGWNPTLLRLPDCRHSLVTGYFQRRAEMLEQSANLVPGC